MQEEKEEKPKKLFVVTHIVWDDGEVDTEMSEYRKNPSGRGAPTKWRLGSKDFKRRIEETLGDADQIGEVMSEHMALDAQDDVVSIKPIKPPRGHTPDPTELAELERGNEKPVDETPKDVTESTDDVDFGDFDKDA
jgi:hypothetical protein